MTPEQIKEAIAAIPSLSDDELVHQYKCGLKFAKQLKPFLNAIERERKARGKIRLIEDDTYDTKTDTAH